MNILLGKATMKRDSEDGYVGQVEFEVEGHSHGYEITLYSKKGKEWEFGLHFSGEPGNEEHIFAVEEYLEEDDEAFERLVTAALNAQ